MWAIIAEKSEETKSFWNKSQALFYMEKENIIDNKNDVFLNCFCCDYASTIYGDWTNEMCIECPINWEIDSEICPCTKSYYNMWLQALDKKDLNNFIRLASIISNLKPNNESKNNEIKK